MKPDYYTNAKEHVMTYKVWQTMKVRDVSNIIGPVIEVVKPRTKGKKARKAAKEA